MWKLCVIVLISASVLQMIDAQDRKPAPKCPKGQYWDDCGTACPVNCQNVGYQPIPCIKKCVAGCFCTPPYIFLSGTSGPCVHPKNCPKTGPKCLKNQYWTDCGTACPINCQNVNNPPVECTYNCVPGCFCRSPYIFQYGKSGPCVPPKYCPIIDPPPPKPIDVQQ